MKENLYKNKGFTLVELIVVIAIIGILAAVLVPSLTGYIAKAKDSAAIQEAETVETAYLTWRIERDGFADDDARKTDFSAYLSTMLSSDQSVEPIQGSSYETGFFFNASNGRKVKVEYEDLTGSLTMEIVPAA